jgi:Rrf2 family iron-sulfur cluster assembly transcriptional regulator
MKITAQEEYGLRILIRIAACRTEEGMTIPQLTEAEGLSSHYVAKLTRILRMEGFINSRPGNKGGYVLARPAGDIRIKNVLKARGGVLFDNDFCGMHAGSLNLCTHSADCSSRSLWKMIQFTLDRLLDKVTLKDLVSTERESEGSLNLLLEESLYSSKTPKPEKVWGPVVFLLARPVFYIGIVHVFTVREKASWDIRFRIPTKKVSLK